LTKLEAFFLTTIILVATTLGDLSVYVKLDAFQRASITLVRSLDEARNKLLLLDRDHEDKSLNEILRQVKAGQEKTDMVANQAVEIAKQTEQLGKQNAAVLEELKQITTQHTKDIEQTKRAATEASSAARRARANTIQTQKTIATPWWKRH
jgi:hypothetical protein